MRQKTAIWDAVVPHECLTDKSAPKYKCICCDLPYAATATRIEEHLTGGSKNIRACPQVARLPSNVSSFLGSRQQPLAKRAREGLLSQATVAQLFGNDKSAAADLAVSEFVYGCGLPPNLARSCYFKNMVSAIQAAPCGYKPPGSEKLRTSLLQQTKERCESALQPLYEEHVETGCTLCCDEWSNVNRESVINFLVVSPSGALFHSAAECSKETKTGEWIAEQIASVIEKIGSSNVVQVRSHSDELI
jgi:hypothetical protein